MNILVRRAMISDLQGIQGLNKRLFEKEHEEYDKTLNLDWTFSKEGRQYYEEHITDEDSFAAVAILDGKIIGYLCGAMCEKPSSGEDYRNLPPMAELEDTIVLNEYRSQGVGTKLYHAFIDWCKHKGVKRLKVVASAQNQGAIRLYRKLGFNDYTLTLEKEIEI